MNIVLLSGGSGKRLWPLSNETLSKQFLKLMKNERGEYESMVQRVIRQLNSAHAGSDIYVSCNVAHDDILHRQLDSVETILEPSRRDTFPAIVLSAAYLHYSKQIDEDEAFIVCPIDVFADNKYFELFEETIKLTEKHKIGLMGAIPTYPSEKYGYILVNNESVTGFVEKPTAENAGKLIAEGALWNCGVFAVKIGYILNHARKYIEFDSFQAVCDQYLELPKISFDYEVVEKESSIGALIYDGVWKDLGTWNTLTEEISGGTIGDNILLSNSCVNTHVINMLNIPIIVQDISDAVVIASYDGILVSSKHGSSFLKPLAEQVHLRPMYEQRTWGNYRVLEYIQNATKGSSLVKRMHLDAGKAISYQYHSKRTEVWVVVNGKGILTIDDIDSVVSQGSVITIPSGVKHSLLAATELEFIEVQLGSSELEEDDIIRINK